MTIHKCAKIEMVRMMLYASFGSLPIVVLALGIC